MKDFLMPDYKRCNLNISATLAEFLGAPNRIPTLPVIKKELSKNYKNIVFICFDGFGIEPINRNLPPDDFLRQNIVDTLVSTFPSTTTNATTSLLFNKYPLEHGWFGWSMYYEDINSNIDIFTNRNSVTRTYVDNLSSPLGIFDYYFDNATSEYSINTVFPPYVRVTHPERNTVINTVEDLGNAVQNICGRQGKQFIYAYHGEPDSTMHKFGVTSEVSKQVIKTVSSIVRNLFDSVKDTLFIITADHGQIDVEDYVDLSEDKELMYMLKIYPFMEARAPAFIVKDGKAEAFERYFKEKYNDDFILYSSKELVEKGFFGEYGDKSHLLGDYIAIGTYTHKQAILVPYQTRYKGHHTSLTEEMEVPLIMFGEI